MIGVEIVKDRQTKETFTLQENVVSGIIHTARENGLIIRELGPVITMMPILSMSEKELDFMVETVYRAIQEVSIHKGLIPAAN